MPTSDSVPLIALDEPDLAQGQENAEAPAEREEMSENLTVDKSAKAEKPPEGSVAKHYWTDANRIGVSAFRDSFAQFAEDQSLADIMGTENPFSVRAAK